MTTARCRGTDLSTFQGEPPFVALAAEGIDFAIAKATEGHGYIDPKWAHNVTHAPGPMKAVACYHVIRAGDPKRQADHCVRQWEVLAKSCALRGVHVLPPAIDNEVADRQAPQQLIDNACAMAVRLRELTGMQPIHYSYPSFLIEKCGNLTAPELEACPQWLAWYPGMPFARASVIDPLVTLGARGLLPKLWARAGWTIWQYDGDGGERMPNDVDADFNVARGTFDDLLVGLGVKLRDTEPAPPFDPESTQPDTPTSKSSQSLRAVNAPIIETPRPFTDAATTIRAGEGEHTPREPDET